MGHESFAETNKKITNSQNKILIVYHMTFWDGQNNKFYVKYKHILLLDLSIFKIHKNHKDNASTLIN